MPTVPQGAVLRSAQSVFGEKVFYVTRGRRHWIRDGRWFAQHGLDWPRSVIDVAPQVLLSFLPGGPAPLLWSEADHWSPPPGAGSVDMREIAAVGLEGNGLEVGPGASPYPLPLQCRTLYADRLGHAELETELYPGQLREDLVEPDLIADLDDLKAIPDGSLDFIVGCHVIEHARNPIGALHGAYRCLRPGGSLLLVVPDMERTFDRHRQVTPLDHLVADFTAPLRERDRQHYEEFYRVAFVTPPEAYERTVEERFRAGYAIHYHAWTFASFGAMVEWARRGPSPFSAVWAQPTRAHLELDIEFYYVLTK